MKIIIANNVVPFLYGGAEFLADSLAQKLEEYAHLVEKIYIPFSWKTTQNIYGLSSFIVGRAPSCYRYSYSSLIH